MLQRYIDVSIIPLEYGGECEVVLPYPLNNLTGGGRERREREEKRKEGREERGEERKTGGVR